MKHLINICKHRYDWIALLDVDELIVHRKHNSWAEMMAEVGLRLRTTPIAVV